MLAAPFEPLVPAPAASVEVIAAHERAVPVEVDPNLVPRAAPRAAALVREGREARAVYGFPLYSDSILETLPARLNALQENVTRPRPR